MDTKTVVKQLREFGELSENVSVIIRNQKSPAEKVFTALDKFLRFFEENDVVQVYINAAKICQMKKKASRVQKLKEMFTIYEGLISSHVEEFSFIQKNAKAIRSGVVQDRIQFLAEKEFETDWVFEKDAPCTTACREGMKITTEGVARNYWILADVLEMKPE